MSSMSWKIPVFIVIAGAAAVAVMYVMNAQKKIEDEEQIPSIRIPTETSHEIQNDFEIEQKQNTVVEEPIDFITITIAFNQSSIDWKYRYKESNVSLLSLQQYISKEFGVIAFSIEHKDQHIEIEDDEGLHKAIQDVLHELNCHKLELIVIEYTKKELPLHQLTVNDICNLLKLWVFNDIRYKQNAAKMAQIFIEHQLNAPKIEYLSSSDIRSIVQAQVLQFMTPKSLDLKLDYLEKWKAENAHDLRSKTPQHIAETLYNQPILRLLERIRREQIDGCEMMDILREKRNNIIKLETGWKDEEVQQIRLMFFKYRTCTKQQFNAHVDKTLINDENDKNKMLDSLLYKIKEIMIKECDIEILHYNMKNNKDVREFSATIMNLIDEFIEDHHDEEKELKENDNDNDSYDFIKRVHHKIAQCFVFQYDSNLDEKPLDWICANCGNYNFSQYVNGSMNHNLTHCVLCGITNIDSMILKIRNQDTFIKESCGNDVNDDTRGADIKEDLDILIESVINARNFNLLCLNRNDDKRCPAIMRLSKQLIRYNRWLNAIYADDKDECDIDDINKTIKVEAAEIIDNKRFTEIFIRSAKSTKNITEQHMKLMSKMLDRNADNMANIETFWSMHRTKCLKMMRKHMKIKLGTAVTLRRRTRFALNKEAQKQQFGEFIANIDINSIDRDYHHILESHIVHGNKITIENTFRFFHTAIHYEEAMIDNKCKSLQRKRQRIKSIKTHSAHIKHDEEEVNRSELQRYYIQEQLDIIHCYFVHADWTHYILNETEEENDTIISEGSDEILAPNKEKYVSTKSVLGFGFGVNHEHDQLKAIYHSIYDEIVYNKQCALEPTTFNKSLVRALKLHKVAIQNDPLLCKMYNTRYQIIRNEFIGIKHIFAIIVYTDISNFCKTFRETYRKINDETEDEQVVNRHREFYHFARSLFEAVEFFGEEMDPTLYVFHGLNLDMKFEKFAAYFNGPISVTTSMRIAIQFSQCIGVILGLKTGVKYIDDCTKRPKYLSVSWLSSFPNEDEKLFYGSYNVLEICDIIETKYKSLVHHAKELKMFNKFQKMLQNRDVTWNKKQDVMIETLTKMIERQQIDIMKHRINEVVMPTAYRASFSNGFYGRYSYKYDENKHVAVDDEKEITLLRPSRFITKYGSTLFEFYCHHSNTTKICIKNIKLLPKSLQSILFCNDGNHFSIIPILKLFPNLKEIILNDLDIYHMVQESNNFVNAVYECINTKHANYGNHFKQITFKSKQRNDGKQNMTLKRLEETQSRELKKHLWSVQYEYEIEATHRVTFTDDLMAIQDEIERRLQKLRDKQHLHHLQDQKELMLLQQKKQSMESVKRIREQTPFNYSWGKFEKERDEEFKIELQKLEAVTLSTEAMDVLQKMHMDTKQIQYPNIMLKKQLDNIPQLHAPTRVSVGNICKQLEHILDDVFKNIYSQITDTGNSVAVDIDDVVMKLNTYKKIFMDALLTQSDNEKDAQQELVRNLRDNIDAITRPDKADVMRKAFSEFIMKLSVAILSGGVLSTNIIKTAQQIITVILSHSHAFAWLMRAFSNYNPNIDLEVKSAKTHKAFLLILPHAVCHMQQIENEVKQSNIKIIKRVGVIENDKAIAMLMYHWFCLLGKSLGKSVSTSFEDFMTDIDHLKTVSNALASDSTVDIDIFKQYHINPILFIVYHYLINYFKQSKPACVVWEIELEFELLFDSEDETSFVKDVLTNMDRFNVWCPSCLGEYSASFLPNTLNGKLMIHWISKQDGMKWNTKSNLGCVELISHTMEKIIYASDIDSLTSAKTERLLPMLEDAISNEKDDNYEDDTKEKNFSLENMGSSLYVDLARFMRTLPQKSKQHIWEHGIKIKSADGKKTVGSQTKDKDQITRLLCDCVIVYVKYLDRNRAPLSTRKVRPHVEKVAVFIQNHYHPLIRDKFENDKTYFAQMLEDYVKSLSKRGSTDSTKQNTTELMAMMQQEVILLSTRNANLEQEIEECKAHITTLKDEMDALTDENVTNSVTSAKREVTDENDDNYNHGASAINKKDDQKKDKSFQRLIDGAEPESFASIQNAATSSDSDSISTDSTLGYPDSPDSTKQNTSELMEMQQAVILLSTKHANLEHELEEYKAHITTLKDEINALTDENDTNVDENTDTALIEEAVEDAKENRDTDKDKEDNIKHEDEAPPKAEDAISLQTKTTSKDHDDEKQHPKLTSTPSSSRKSRSKRFNLSRLEDQIEVLSSEEAKARSLLLCTKPEIVSQNTDDGKTKTRNFGFIMFLETSMGDKMVDQLYSKFKANAVDGKQLASLLTLTVIIYKVKLHKLKTGSKDKPPMDSSSIKGSVEHLSAWIIRSYGDKVGPKKQVSVTDDTGRMIKGEYKTITATIDKKQFQKGITSWVHKYVEMEGSLNES